MIIVINPGSTSTKTGIYHRSKAVFQQTVRHPEEELSPYASIGDQLRFREQFVMQQIERSEIDKSQIRAVIGRGGLIKPVESGTYEVNQLMIDHLSAGLQGQHASNLGGLIAAGIARTYPQAKAYIADPVVVDELQPCARISGHPLFERVSVFHALNQKAVARLYAESVNRPYETLNLIVAHLGGGISVGAHHKGKVIDVNQALDGEGPFSPERSGTLPAGQLINLCFDKKYTQKEIRSMLCGKGGLAAYCNSKDVQRLISQAQSGNEHTALTLDAMCYQVAKEIGAMAAVLKGEVDQIILTGGMAYETAITGSISKYISFLAPVTVYPGEDEMAALAMNAQMVLDGTIVPKTYT